MDRKYRELILENSDNIIRKWMEQVNDGKVKEYSSTISDDVIEQMNREFINIIFASLNETDDKTAEKLNGFSKRVVNLGWPLGYLTEGMQTIRGICMKEVLSQIEIIDRQDFIVLMDHVNSWVDPIKIRLINEYSNNWVNIISLQKVALEELSAPLIPVMDGITVMPLVGTIDTERAKLIMENLLNGVIKNRAEVVLIDITGVPVVDTMVAHHIIQAAEAVRLIGAKCILVGIRPEIAQTIVNLGIDLTNFPTKSSLKKGFESALAIMGKQIISTGSNDDVIEDIIRSIDKE
ncbi:STAS domain-containing protein [Bacillaceae bacterium W0354]